MFQIQGVIRPHAIIILPSSSGMELLLCTRTRASILTPMAASPGRRCCSGGRCPPLWVSSSTPHTPTHTHTTHTHTHTHAHRQTHTHTHTHTHAHRQTHTHTHICWFLWFTGTLHRRNGFYTIKLYVLFPYTYPTPKLSPHRRRCISTFPPKSAHCMIYKHFKLWGH